LAEIKAIAFPFHIATGGGTIAYRTVLLDQVKDSIKQIVLTSFQERVMLPAFGTGVNELIFDILDDATLVSIVKNDIEEGMKAWEFRCELANLSAKTDQIHGTVFFLISISLLGQSQEFSIEVNTKQG
jgi:phage baseplate assembly protein W